MDTRFSSAIEPLADGGTPGDAGRSGQAMPSYEEALEFLLARARTPLNPPEEANLLDSLGRVLAEDVVAATAVPPWSNSAMDGFALHSRDVPPEGEVHLPVSQRVPAGAAPTPLQPGTAVRIFTGARMPSGADTVVIQERCRLKREQVVFRAPVEPGDNVRPRGNDVGEGEQALAAGTRIRPQEMALAAATGHAKLRVHARLKVALLITGDEVVSPQRPLGPGEIYDSNRYLLGGLLQTLGCSVTGCAWPRDDLETTRDALVQAAESADLVLATGGVSVGEEDHVRAAVESIGTLNLWRVRIKPGKPLAFGSIGASDFIGLPGNPVSALVTFLLFVRPFILRRQGVRDVEPARIPVVGGFEHQAGQRTEFLRARLSADGGASPRATIFPRQGSDVLSSAVWAQGLVEIPEGVTVRPGDQVVYIPFTELLA